MRTPQKAALLFVCVYLAHALMPVSIQGDSRWTIPTALSLVHRHTPDLRGSEPAIVASGFYAIECVFPDKTRIFPVTSLEQCSGGALYNFYPVAVAVVAAPLVAALEGAIRLAGPLLEPVARHFPHPWILAFVKADLAGASPLVENLVSACFTAGAAAALYVTALELVAAAPALVFALVFAFGTLAWSLASRALWQHSPSMFLNSVVLLLLVRGDLRRGFLILAGFLLALAFFVRPTNVVPAAVLGLYLLRRCRGGALWSAAGALLPIALFGWLNLATYGSVLAPYFLPVRPGSDGLAVHGQFFLALAVNLFSPARGLFVFMPFFLLLLVPRTWTHPLPARFGELRPWLCAVAILHLLLVLSWTDWWGGYSFGPRFLTDILPYLMLLWLPAVSLSTECRPFGAVTVILVLAAVFVQFRGATSMQPHHWNSVPVDVNQHRERLWDWTDPPFLRGLR